MRGALHIYFGVNGIGLMYMALAVKYCNAFAIPRLTTRFNVVDSEHRVITTADCIQFVVVVHAVLMCGYYYW